jgi:flagellar basal-body rod modification protein FlgD
MSVDELFNGSQQSVRRVTYSQDSGTTRVDSEGDLSSFTDEAQESMGKDEFLQLLVTQLQHQDPLSPQEDGEFAAQLAQFSALENSQNTANAMTDLAGSMQSFMDNQTSTNNGMTQASAVSMIGKEALVERKTLTFDNVREGVSFDVHADSNRPVMVVISDNEGNEVYSAYCDEPMSGQDEFSLHWNGGDMSGEMVNLGEYTVNVYDESGMNDGGYVFARSQVSGISYEDGQVLLAMDGENYRLSDLIEVRG